MQANARRFWTAAEDAILADLYPNLLCIDIAALLDCKPGSVYSAASRLGLQKSEHFKAGDTSGRIQRGKQNPRMIEKRFQPGMTSWNAGMKGWQAGGRSVLTQFQKGQMSVSAQRKYKPIGSLRISRDGYLERKMTDNPALVPTRRWTAVHRLVWEAAHGPIPKGHVVVYKAGQRTAIEQDITPDRLECISRGELANRNHPNRTNPEIARLIQLKGAITRQVNRIKKESATV
jgi:HNH endonuclease